MTKNLRRTLVAALVALGVALLVPAPAKAASVGYFAYAGFPVNGVDNAVSVYVHHDGLLTYDMSLFYSASGSFCEARTTVKSSQFKVDPLLDNATLTVPAMACKASDGTIVKSLLPFSVRWAATGGYETDPVGSLGAVLLLRRGQATTSLEGAASGNGYVGLGAS